MAGIKRRDPRQLKFKRLYSDPKSPTFGNAKQSAIAAGFSARYAARITVDNKSLVTEALSQYDKMLQKAERNLDAMLDEPVEEPMIGMFGPLKDKETGQPIMRRNPKIMALKHDASKFVAERIGKKNFSLKDPTGGEGAERPTPILQQFNVYINNGDQENRGPEEARPGDTGGQLSE